MATSGTRRTHAEEMPAPLNCHESQGLLRAGRSQADVAARAASSVNGVRRVKREADLTRKDDAPFAQHRLADGSSLLAREVRLSSLGTHSPRIAREVVATLTLAERAFAAFEYAADGLADCVVLEPAAFVLDRGKAGPGPL